MPSSAEPLLVSSARRWKAQPVRTLLALSLAAAPLVPLPLAAQRAASARAAAPGARAEVSVPFRPGETLTYDVAWSKYLTAGTLTMRVAEKKPSYRSVAYYLVAEGRPVSIVASLYSLYYKADSLLDVYTLLPQRGSIYSEEGKRRRMKVTQFDHGAKRADYEVRTATIVKSQLGLAPQTQDVLSAIYVLRAFALRPNARITLPVSDGGKHYTVRMQIGQVEQVKCGLGTVPAFRITPTAVDAQGRSILNPTTLWLSSDPSHVPLKLQTQLSVGSIVLTLKSRS